MLQESTERLKQLDCAGQRERDVNRRGPGGFVQPTRTALDEPQPALTISLTPGGSLLFSCTFKGETGKRRIIVNQEGCHGEADTC